jgi:hypothetical protein
MREWPVTAKASHLPNRQANCFFVATSQEAIVTQPAIAADRELPHDGGSLA